MPGELPLDTKLTVRVPHELLEQARQRCQAEDVSLSLVVRTALQDYIRYGMEMSIRRAPPKENSTEAFF